MEEKKCNILVVDDEEDITQTFSSFFERRGYCVITANSAEEALPIIKQYKPDIMLLDINLPEMSGVELLKLVRQFNNTLKVIVISGYELDFHNEMDLEQLNILEFKRKPVSFDEIETAVKKAFS